LTPAVADAAVGYGPAELDSAYAIPTGLSGGTVAIVDAYDDPNAEADLATYRAHYGLPACTTANGCFRKVSQTGDPTHLPAADSSGWATEVALDVEMASAACPLCHILLVEASGVTNGEISAAENYAAGAPGVRAVSEASAGRRPPTTPP
jgi:subtilase family serine protease